MAVKIMTAITAAAASQTSSDDPGEQAIDICTNVWTCAHNELSEDNPQDGKIIK